MFATSEDRSIKLGVFPHMLNSHPIVGSILDCNCFHVGSGMEATTKKYSSHNFTKQLTAEEKVQYDAIKTGAGVSQRKKQFRDMLAAQKLKNLSAVMKDVVSATTEDRTVGTYRNFWVIAEKEGGLMDRDTGIQVATSTLNQPLYCWPMLTLVHGMMLHVPHHFL